MTEEVEQPPAMPRSADEQLLNCAGPSLLARQVDDPGRLDRIRAELERGFQSLSHVDKGVSDLRVGSHANR